MKPASVRCPCPIPCSARNNSQIRCAENSVHRAHGFCMHGLRYQLDLLEYNPCATVHELVFRAYPCTDSVDSPCADSCRGGACLY